MQMLIKHRGGRLKIKSLAHKKRKTVRPSFYFVFAQSTMLRVVTVFQAQEYPAQESRHHEINQRDGIERFFINGIATANRTLHISQLRHSDDGQERTVFQKRNKFAGKRRQHTAQRLRKNHIAHRLRITQTQRTRCFHLTAVDGLDARAENLADIRAGVGNQGKRTGNQCAVRTSDFYRS